MTDTTDVAVSGAPMRFRPLMPVLPADLQALLDAARPRRFTTGIVGDPSADMVIRGRDLTPTPSQQAAAREALKAFSRAMEPVTPNRLLRWLERLNDVVAIRSEDGAVRLRALGFMTAFDGYPAAAFGEESLREAMREFDFLPSAAKAAKVIDQHVDRLRSDLVAVQKMADWKPPPPQIEQAPATDEDRVRVSEAACGVYARTEESRRAWIEDREPDPDVQPSRRALLIAYDRLAALGNKVAARKAAALRKRIVAEGGVPAEDLL